MFTKLILIQVFNFKLLKDKYKIVNNNRKYRETCAVHWITHCTSIRNENKRKSNKYWNIIIVRKLNAFNLTHNILYSVSVCNMYTYSTKTKTSYNYTAHKTQHIEKSEFILYRIAWEICDLFYKFSKISILFVMFVVCNTECQCPSPIAFNGKLIEKKN